MLTIEVKVNGNPVTVINAVNRGLGDLAAKTHEYEYQGCTFPLDNRGPVTTFHGTLKHIRKDGINILVETLLKAIR